MSVSTVSLLEGGGAGRRYSKYYITINTNHKARTAQAEQYLKTRLKSFLDNRLPDPDILESMLIFTPNLSIIDHVVVEAGVEVGPKTGFVHAHAELLIEHHGQVRLKKAGAQAALQRAVIESTGVRGAYVGIQLASAYLLNYVSKTTKASNVTTNADGSTTVLPGGGIRDEIVF